MAEDRIEELSEAPAEHVPLSDPEFKEQLSAVIPHLRAFGRSLSGSRDLADDLVQETLLKAWAARQRFQAGTNMRAWTFIILRNLFLSQMRRARFKGEWDDITASKILAAPASQDRHIELGDMQRALMHLPQPQRDCEGQSVPTPPQLDFDFGRDFRESDVNCRRSPNAKERLGHIRKLLDRFTQEGRMSLRADDRAFTSLSVAVRPHSTNRWPKMPFDETSPAF